MISKIEFPDVYIPFIQTNKRYQVLMGGRNSCKSHTAYIKGFLKITTQKKCKILCLRETKEKIEETVYAGFIKIIKIQNAESQFRFLRVPFKIIHIPTGNTIIFGGLNDPASYKGLEEITDVMVDEAESLTKDAFDTIDQSIRGGTFEQQSFILTLNPISQYLWIKPRFFDDPCKDTYTLITTYLDNPYASQFVHDKFARMKIDDPDRYEVEGLAHWGNENKDANFYKKFSNARHVGNCLYNPELPLLISFDFNSNPGCSAVIGQKNGKKLSIIDEIFLENPNNTTKDLCIEFKRRYYNHTGGVLVFGDASGKNNQNMTVRGYNHFSVIQTELSSFKPQIRTASKNPDVLPRQLFINDIFSSEFENIQVLINEKCVKLLEDFTFLKEDNGQKFKESWKNPKTGIREQKYGHFTDCFDYMITELFRSEYRYHKTGKKDFNAIYGRDIMNERFRY